MSAEQSQYMTEDEVAAALEIRVSTLRKQRYSNPDHPPYLKVGASVRYLRKEFWAWVETHVVRPRGPEQVT